MTTFRFRRINMLIARNQNLPEAAMASGEAKVTGFPSRQNVNVTELFEDIRALPRPVRQRILAMSLGGLTEPEIVDVIVGTKIMPEIYGIYRGLKKFLRG
jgi:hypothetical protein